MNIPDSDTVSSSELDRLTSLEYLEMEARFEQIQRLKERASDIYDDLRWRDENRDSFLVLGSYSPQAVVSVIGFMARALVMNSWADHLRNKAFQLEQEYMFSPTEE